MTEESLMKRKRPRMKQPKRLSFCNLILTLQNWSLTIYFLYCCGSIQFEIKKWEWKWEYNTKHLFAEAFQIIICECLLHRSILSSQCTVYSPLQSVKDSCTNHATFPCAIAPTGSSFASQIWSAYLQAPMPSGQMIGWVLDNLHKQTLSFIVKVDCESAKWNHHTTTHTFHVHVQKDHSPQWNHTCCFRMSKSQPN